VVVGAWTNKRILILLLAVRRYPWKDEENKLTCAYYYYAGAATAEGYLGVLKLWLRDASCERIMVTECMTLLLVRGMWDVG
jgi:hypothetical protein